MKIFISLSSPRLVQEEYTGDSGLYSAVVPDEVACRMIAKLAKAFGYEIDPSDLHCTVMYSAEKCPKQAACDSNTQYPARFTKVQHWVGHDDKGYLTVGLSSPALTAEHNRLKKLGCEASFDYSPHITLYSGVDLTEELSQKIKRLSAKVAQWPEIQLSNQFIGNCKPDA